MEERLTVKERAALFNVSERMIYYARRVARSGREDLFRAVERGEMTVHAALRIIDGPKQIDRYANLVRAWNAATDAARRRHRGQGGRRGAGHEKAPGYHTKGASFSSWKYWVADPMHAKDPRRDAAHAPG